ncbi:U9-like protein [Lissonota sp. PSUC_FEM 10030012]|nr:U9-like protein [Lissonota sp. PSUC_FEM 10030012]
MHRAVIASFHNLLDLGESSIGTMNIVDVPEFLSKYNLSGLKKFIVISSLDDAGRLAKLKNPTNILQYFTLSTVIEVIRVSAVRESDSETIRLYESWNQQPNDGIITNDTPISVLEIYIKLAKSKAMNVFCSIAKNLFNVANNQTGKIKDNGLIKLLNEHDDIKCDVLKTCEYHESATVSFIVNVEQYDVPELLVNAIKKFTDEWFKIFDLRKIGAILEDETCLQMFPAVLSDDALEATDCIKELNITFDVQYPEGAKNPDDSVTKLLKKVRTDEIPLQQENSAGKRKREESEVDESQAKRLNGSFERGRAGY